MIGFELEAGPAVSLLKLNSDQIVCFCKLAVFSSSLTAVLRELESDDCVGGYGFFKSDACTRSGNIFQDCPLTSSRSGPFLPLHFYEISTKLSILLSIRPHNYSIGKPEQLFRLNCTRKRRRKGGDREEAPRIFPASNRIPLLLVSSVSGISYFMAARALS